MKPFFITFEVGQGVSEINPQGFHVSVWKRGKFFEFVHFSDFEVQYLPEYSRKNLRIYAGYPRTTA